MEFLAMLQKTGFEHTELVGKTGFNSSPKTEGTLFRAIKPESSVFLHKLTEKNIPVEKKVQITTGGT